MDLAQQPRTCLASAMVVSPIPSTKKSKIKWNKVTWSVATTKKLRSPSEFFLCHCYTSCPPQASWKPPAYSRAGQLQHTHTHTHNPAYKHVCTHKYSDSHTGLTGGGRMGFLLIKVGDIYWDTAGEDSICDPNCTFRAFSSISWIFL